MYIARRFIPVAEESGMIVPLGNWTLRQDGKAAVRLTTSRRAVPLSVDVSPRQFRQDDCVDQVCGALAQSGADSTQLIFEVTEGVLIENLEDTIACMVEIASLSIRFSIVILGEAIPS